MGLTSHLQGWAPHLQDWAPHLQAGLHTCRAGLHTCRVGLRGFCAGLHTCRAGLGSFRVGLRGFCVGLHGFRAGLCGFRTGLRGFCARIVCRCGLFAVPQKLNSEGRQKLSTKHEQTKMKFELFGPWVAQGLFWSFCWALRFPCWALWFPYWLTWFLRWASHLQGWALWFPCWLTWFLRRGCLSAWFFAVPRKSNSEGRQKLSTKRDQTKMKLEFFGARVAQGLFWTF